MEKLPELKELKLTTNDEYTAYVWAYYEQTGRIYTHEDPLTVYVGESVNEYKQALAQRLKEIEDLLLTLNPELYFENRMSIMKAKHKVQDLLKELERKE
jgi:hypothetical protein